MKEAPYYLRGNPWSGPCARLERHELQDLLRYLPEPIARGFLLEDVYFEVYRAKKILEDGWEDKTLFQLLVEARASYYRYGHIPPLDEYDKKSAIYLARFRYLDAGNGASPGTQIEEWHSTRVVPVRGVPHGLEDLELFACRGRSVGEEARRMTAHSDAATRNSWVASSRTCAIPPFVAADQEAELSNATTLKYRHTPLGLAMVHHYFWKDSVAARLHCSHMVSIAVPRLIATGFTVETGGRKFAPDFVPAHLFLAAPAGDVRLNRNALEQYAYRFPAYFLNIRQLLILLDRLSADGVLPPAVLEEYLGTKVDLAAMRSGVDFEKIKHLGRLLTTQGKINGADMSGEELRAMADREVDDGPILHITEFSSWVRSINVMLAAVSKRDQMIQ